MDALLDCSSCITLFKGIWCSIEKHSNLLSNLEDQIGLGTEKLLIKWYFPRIALLTTFCPPHPLLLRRVWALVYCVIAPVITYKLAPPTLDRDKKLSFLRLMAEPAPTEQSHHHHNTKHATRRLWTTNWPKKDSKINNEESKKLRHTKPKLSKKKRQQHKPAIYCRKTNLQ